MQQQDSNLSDPIARGVLFQGLVPDAAAALLACAHVRQIPSGSAAFHQGDAPDQLVQVVKGLLRLTQVNAEGGRNTLRLVQAGEIAGCVAVFQQIPYPATATAVEDTTICCWRRASFVDLMGRYPCLVDSALRIVGQRAQEMVERLGQMSARKVEQRIAAALLQLAERAGTRDQDGIRVAFPITRDYLAEMGGVTYFTISRILSSWQQAGLIRSGRQWIMVLDQAALARVAQGAAA